VTIYREESPEPALSDWVECSWTLESDTAISGYRVPPDGCLDLIYDRVHGLRAIGTMTVEQRFDIPAGVGQTGIRFRPGMAGPFLGVSPAELTDAAVSFSDLCSRRAGELTRQMDDAESIRHAMRILQSNLRPSVSAPNPVQKAILSIEKAHGNTDLEYVARQANLSPRQFRRRCLEESGLTPKLLCRVLRFRRAYLAACEFKNAATRPDWAAIALESQYFDQAHFIQDFRAFTGMTPMAVFSNTLGRGAGSIGA
jgi:AraC-like DNA-binding protein